MAATGQRSRSGGRGRRLVNEINVVPYIDVMLVLLVIFIVAAPLLQHAVPLVLPRAASQPQQAPAESIKLA